MSNPDVVAEAISRIRTTAEMVIGGETGESILEDVETLEKLYPPTAAADEFSLRDEIAAMVFESFLGWESIQQLYVVKGFDAVLSTIASSFEIADAFLGARKK